MGCLKDKVIYCNLLRLVYIAHYRNGVKRLENGIIAVCIKCKTYFLLIRSLVKNISLIPASPTIQYPCTEYLFAFSTHLLDYKTAANAFRFH